MTGMASDSGQAATSPREFVTTHWSVVLAARHPSSPDAQRALEQLCRTYWYPLYAYVRRCGHNPDDAQDLTQEFFAHLLAGNYVAAAEPRKGKFRWFLLCAVKRFLLKERERLGALKRGGGLTFLPFDDQQAEGRYRLEIADPTAPDRLFDRAWAIAVIERAHELLRQEYLVEGKGDLFERLKVFLSSDHADMTYEEVGGALQMAEGAVKVAVHRLRRRLGDLLREQIAQTVQTSAELEDELRHLRTLFSS
jgi:RNA polymerase sigma-70 factor (ECF subfamily)